MNACGFVLALNPVALHRYAVIVNFVFQNAAVFLYRPRQGHVIPVAAHQHAAYPQPVARLQRQRNHLRFIAFSPLTGANAIANVPAVMQQLFR